MTGSIFRLVVCYRHFRKQKLDEVVHRKRHCSLVYVLRKVSDLRVICNRYVETRLVVARAFDKRMSKHILVNKFFFFFFFSFPLTGHLTVLLLDCLYEVQLQ